MNRVLFVCLGNICRSPAAEAIFRQMAATKNIEDRFQADSAGTGGWHVGEMPDGRMTAHAQERGYDLTPLRARQFDPRKDFKDFDLILTMDRSVHKTLLGLVDDTQKGRVKEMISYCKVHDVAEVPDPYYKGDDGFELVLDILEDACSELLIQLNRATPD